VVSGKIGANRPRTSYPVSTVKLSPRQKEDRYDPQVTIIGESLVNNPSKPLQMPELILDLSPFSSLRVNHLGVLIFMNRRSWLPFPGNEVGNEVGNCEQENGEEFWQPCEEVPYGLA